MLHLCHLVCAQLLTQPAESQEEITARHHIADQLERRFIPRPLCKSSLFAEFSNELKILKEAGHSGSGKAMFIHPFTQKHTACFHQFLFTIGQDD